MRPHGSAIACTAPSIPAGRPAQRLSDPQAAVALAPVHMITNLATARRQISPHATGRVPGSLSSANRRFASIARTAAQGGDSLAIHMAHSESSRPRAALSTPWSRSHACSSTPSVPLIPAPPVSWDATRSTWSSVTWTGMGRRAFA